MFDMSRSTFFVIVILLLLTGLFGWNYFARPFADVESGNQSEVVPSPQPGNPPTATVEFSPEEAVAQVLAYPIVVKATVPVTASASAELPSVLPSEDLTWIKRRRPALVTLFGSKISSQSARLATGELRAAYNDQQVVIAVDHEGGTTQRLSGPGFTALPSWRSVCALSETESALQISNSLQEVKEAGVDLVLAPVVDVGNAAPMGSRICSDQSDVVIRNASKFIEIAQARGLVPVIKHFPGIGSTTRDLHRAFDQVTVTAADAQIYQQLLNRFSGLAVVVTHVGVVNQFADIPCSLSQDCIGELKNNYPQSLVIADALEMTSAANLPPGATTATTSATQPASLAQRSVAAIKAGNQVLLFGQAVTAEQMEDIYQTLLTEYRNNSEFKAQIDLAAQRVLQLQQQAAQSL